MLSSSFQTIGQSLWLDHIARDVIFNGSLIRNIKDWSISGLSLHPYTVYQVLNESDVYDRAISKKINEGLCGEALASELMLEDAHHAADLVRHVFDKTDSVDGWVSLPFSPLNVTDLSELKNAIVTLHSQFKRPNVLINVPGGRDNSELIEELVYAGIPINIMLVCSHDQYMHAAQAYIQAIEKRIEAGRNPAVPAFSSILTSDLMQGLSMKMGRDAAIQVTLATARQIYRSMRKMHTSPKWERAYNSGARFLRLIWVNSVDEHMRHNDGDLPNQLVAPLTVASMSVPVLNECMRSGQRQTVMPENGDDCDEVLARSRMKGLNMEVTVSNHQRNFADSLVRSWIMLLDMIARKTVSIIGN